MRSLALILFALLPLLAILGSFPRTAIAATPPAPPAGLAFTATPQVTDVGGQVLLSLHARKWPSFAAVTVSFLSAHHGFSGKMPWRPACACFQIAVILARRIHALEHARAVAKISYDHALTSAFTGFQIRGLASNGKDFSPGGTVFLSGWVSDPQPAAGEQEHFCAWVRTVDSLGVAGYRVTFVAHYPRGKQTFSAGPTNVRGVACSQHSIGNPGAGKRVNVDIYAAGRHVTASFAATR